MRRIITPLVLASLILSACSRTVAKNPDPNHTHADFTVWIDGKKLDFSADKYMEEGQKGVPIPSDQKSMRTYMHLHDGNGHVIHRQKPGLTIGDFMKGIGFSMQPRCLILDTKERICNQNGNTLRMFINGRETAYDPNYSFRDLDKILITYGSSDTEIQRELLEMPDDACLYSKTCPERGKPPAEKCITDPAVPCENN